jgi:hypothetical protein
MMNQRRHASRHSSFSPAHSIISGMMPEAGLEPARLSAKASKTFAAANYATPATLSRTPEIKGLKFESLANALSSEEGSAKLSPKAKPARPVERVAPVSV